MMGDSGKIAIAVEMLQCGKVDTTFQTKSLNTFSILPRTTSRVHCIQALLILNVVFI